MHPVAFRKAMTQAYMAGAESVIQSESKETPSKQDAKDWFDNEYGLLKSEECDCCEEED
jgi:hypothetical protein